MQGPGINPQHQKNQQTKPQTLKSIKEGSLGDHEWHQTESSEYRHLPKSQGTPPPPAMLAPAVPTCVRQHAVASVATDVIKAGSLVQTRVGGTLIYIHLAVVAWRRRRRRNTYTLKLSASVTHQLSWWLWKLEVTDWHSFLWVMGAPAHSF